MHVWAPSAFTEYSVVWFGDRGTWAPPEQKQNCGEAGIGKSRLVQVLKDHIAEGRSTRLECRSSPYYQNPALYPIIDLLERGAGFQRDEPPQVKLDKLEHTLNHYQLPLEETVPLFATLLSLPVPKNRYPALNLSPHQQRQRTLETTVALLLALAERQPLAAFLCEHTQDIVEENTHAITGSSGDYYRCRRGGHRPDHGTTLRSGGRSPGD